MSYGPKWLRQKSLPTLGQELSPLFKLGPEIREMIYREVLGNQSIDIIREYSQAVYITTGGLRRAIGFSQARMTHRRYPDGSESRLPERRLWIRHYVRFYEQRYRLDYVPPPEGPNVRCAGLPLLRTCRRM
jgi:hypothetical protein